MMKVTSAEFTREFGRFRALAHREAVVVTHHGRDDVVLIAADDYVRLRSCEQRAVHVARLPGEDVDEPGTVAIPEVAAKFSGE